MNSAPLGATVCRSSECDILHQVIGVQYLGGGFSKLCLLPALRFIGGELVVICVEVSNKTEIVFAVPGALLFASGRSRSCPGVVLCICILFSLALCRGRCVVCLLFLCDMVSISEV